MTRRASNLPELRIEELPIPADAQPDHTWTGQMMSIARLIGPYATLLLVDRFGGQQIYVPATFRGDHKIARAIGLVAARELAREYGNCRVTLPTAKAAIARAKRGPIIAAVRRKEMNAVTAARILRTSRNYVAGLVNNTDEGGKALATPTPQPRQMDLLAGLDRR